MEEKNRRKFVRGVEILLFAAYLAVLCYFLFFAENLGRAFTEREYHYNLMPLKEIRRFITYRHTLGFWSASLNLAGNVVAFIGSGVFLPRLFPGCRKFFLTMLFGFEFSLCVELIQLVGKVGSFDVDDILLNTMGGILGFCCYRVSVRLARNRRSGDWSMEENDEKKKSL